MDVNAASLAAIDTDNGTVVTKNGVDVNTGDENSSYTRATADGVSLIIGALANGRINANATNRTSNTASVTGSGRIDAGNGALNAWASRPRRGAALRPWCVGAPARSSGRRLEKGRGTACRGLGPAVLAAVPATG